MAKRAINRVAGVYASRNGERYEIRFYDGEGRRRSKYSPTKEGAEEIARRLEVALSPGSEATSAVLDGDWLSLLRATAEAALKAGDFNAACNACKVGLQYRPPTPVEVAQPADVRNLPQEELVARLKGCLEKEGY